MILTDQELFEAVGVALQVKFRSTDVDLIDFIDDQIGFDVAINGKWVAGYVKVKYDTDLAVYLNHSDEDDDYRYQFDINWCDILPEGVE